MIRSIITVLLFSVLQISTIAQDKQILDQVLAIVGDEIILESEVEAQAEQMKAQGYYSSRDLNCEVLEELLFAKLLVHQSKIDSIEVTPDEVEAEVNRRVNGYVSQIGSEEKLEEYYKKPIAEIKANMRDVIKEQMLGQRMMQEITSDIDVTPSEIKAFYNSMPEDSLPVVNTQFGLEQVIIYPKIKEVEILRVKDRLREFKERVAKGESFATLAVLYSEDKGTATKGGELGFVSRGDLVPEFSAVAFNLQPGEVSKVVKTDFGYHIIQLIEIKGERMNCRHILLKPRISFDEKEKTIKILDSVQTEINAGNMKFKDACWLYSNDDETRMNGGVMLNPMTGNSMWEASHIDSKVALAIRNLEVGRVSAPFETEDDNGNKVYKIVLLKEKRNPHKANLKEDYQLIQDMALNMKKHDYMQEWIKGAVDKAFIKIDDSYQNCDFNNKAWIK